MNALTKAEQPRSVLFDMAARFGMEPAAFEATVRATCSPAPKKGDQFRPLTREEFAAFLLVSKEYKLNPLTREIYAYPKRGGGVVPIVSIDGWVNLVNSHPACDGFEFDVEHGGKGELVSITCRMYRKDRGRPVSVTEYLSECYRETEPWKMKHRMLRHKALIQSARYAFGFSGIYDEDEGAKIAEMKEINPQDRQLPPAPPPLPPAPPEEAATIEHEPAADEPEADPETGEIVEADDTTAEVTGTEPEDTTDFLDRLDAALASATDEASLEEAWTELDPLAHFEGQVNGELNQGIATGMKRRHLKRVRG